MSSGQLSKRFFFGSNNHSIYLTTQAQHDFFYGIPERQKQIISLAKAQLAAQFETAKAIEQSNFHVAQEIRQFNAAMESAIQQVSDDIVHAIDQLEYSLVCEFREVRWLLAQQGKLSEEIIEILRKRRKVEANELLQQAIANLSNGFYSEAKDRLVRALESDNTDFQVHRNLGFIYLHEGKGEKAVEHFHKATSFAPSVRARFEAIGDLSRTYYAMGNYEKAAQYEDDLLKMTNQNSDLATNDELARRWYNHGVYNGLSRKSDTSTKSLRNAINLKRHYFALASIDRDLDVVRDVVNELLGSISRYALHNARKNFEEFTAQFENIGKSSYSHTNKIINALENHAQIASKKLHSASYSDLLDITDNCELMTKTVNLAKSKKACEHELEKLEKQIQIDQNKLKKLQDRENNRRSKLRRRSEIKASFRRLFASIASLIITGAVFLIIGGALGSFTYISCTNAHQHFRETTGANTPNINIVEDTGEVFGLILKIVFWAIFNLALMLATLLIPFTATIGVWEKMMDFTREAGKPTSLNRDDPRELKNVRSSLSQLNKRCRDLKDKIEDISGQIKNSLNSIIWSK